MQLPAELQSIAELRQLAQTADHIDVKVVEGDNTFREFIAGLMNFSPGWIKALYRVRWAFVRVLGMKQNGIPKSPGMLPENVPMQSGEKAAFFKVDYAQPDHFWIVSAKEAHLTAYLGVVMQPLQGGKRRFHVITIVKYHRWTGPVYFNLIRPFHHLVVNSMARAALRYQAS